MNQNAAFAKNSCHTMSDNNFLDSESLIINFLVQDFESYMVQTRVDQGRAVGVVAGATRAFGRQTQGVWGAGPPTAGGEPSGYQALKPLRLTKI